MLSRVAIVESGRATLSQLLILKEVMDRIQFDLGRKEPLLPCDFFDMISGSGFGGLVAILLARLRLSAEQAIEKYLDLTSALTFKCAPHQEDKRRNTLALKRAFCNLLFELEVPQDALLQEEDGSKPPCYTENMGHTRLFRNYGVRATPEYNPMLVQTILASCSFPSMFEPVQIGKEPYKEKFVTGALNCPNPTREAINESSGLFGDQTPMSVILSLGSGQGSIVSLESAASEEERRQLLHCLITDYARERTHQELERLIHSMGIYFRLNVQKGLEDVDERRESASKVKSNTTAYLGEYSVSQVVDDLVNALLGRRERRIIKGIAVATGYIKFLMSFLTYYDGTVIREYREDDISIEQEDESVHITESLPCYEDYNEQSRIDVDQTKDCTHIVPREETIITQQEKAPPYWRWLLDPAGFGFPVLVVAALWVDGRLGGNNLLTKNIWALT
ncbi:12599_t:CDS:2 [Acaulospora colombiana]|uniref:12599_t:CDS:1 n=1 Tax=Acaulospora colombiana TaxID=27376 RepID=A0ACA9LG85_9GLOM|nr:12599_t:CDS:2 [Acaulospora colombiana]